VAPVVYIGSMRVQRVLYAWVLLALSLAVYAGSARAQATASGANPRNIDATQFGERVTLGPNWLFAPGDNPAWASPAFDDSQWMTVSASKELLEYGIHDIPNGWYRLHVHLRPGTHNLAVALTSIRGSYEVYANGVRIGANGNMAGMVRFIQLGLTAYDVPQSLLGPQGDLVLAIRFSLNIGGNRGRGTSTPIQANSGIYLVSRDAAQRDANYVNVHNAGIDLLLACLGLLAGVIALALYWAMRSRREYLAVAVYLLAAGVSSGASAWDSLHAQTLYSSFPRYFCLGIAFFALIEFIRLVLHLPRLRWLFRLQLAMFIFTVTTPVFNSGVGNYFFGFAVYFFPILIVYILLPVLLIQAWRWGNREARVLLPAVLLLGLGNYWNFLRLLLFYSHITAKAYPLPTLHLGSYDITLLVLGRLVFDSTILLFLVLRTVTIAKERAHAAAELEAARTVQQILIPEEIPSIPGFALGAVYKPAGEVGGDFFQILPVRNGVLVVIGDVSGKGMPAAMTVSLLVGTVRTLAHFTQSPGEILAAMNLRMLHRSGGGFTTCLVLRADADGALTIANAGHIAPYLAGKELPLENGLPLGLAAEATYSETSFQLQAGQQLTLVTDGVVEARDKGGALFGFERTAAISTQPAESIAQAAQAFGQDDDITALTIALISL
jgi:hypothetical protein